MMVKFETMHLFYIMSMQQTSTCANAKATILCQRIPVPVRARAMELRHA